ncbi:MAG: insulinase family protein [Desulfuromonadales bacterium]|nr:insulinase family protein [Desulfuromonadales bacterium]
MIQRTLLDNGIRVLSEKVPGCHSVSLGIWVNNGSRHEVAKFNGISHFLEHMLFKGTERRTAQGIAREIDSVGGVLNGFTSREFSCYFVKILSQKLPMAMDLLGDLLCHSRFDLDEMEKERRVIMQEIAMIEDSPEELIHDQFFRNMWLNHSLGLPVVGNNETVSGIDRETLLDFMAQRYVGNNLAVVAAGDVDHEALLALAQQSLGDIPATGPTVDCIAPLVQRRVEVCERDLEQTQICLGVEGLPQNHDERYGVYLLNTILGGNMSSRLFQKVREELGLAYSVYSYHNNHSDCGSFVVSAATSAENAPLLVRTVIEEMSRLRQSPVSDEELRSAKDCLKGSMLLSMESTDNRMTRLAKNELFIRNVGITLEKSEALIDAVTKETVQSLAERLFIDDTLNLLAMGRIKPNIFPDIDLQIS